MFRSKRRFWRSPPARRRRGRARDPRLRLRHASQAAAERPLPPLVPRGDGVLVAHRFPPSVQGTHAAAAHAHSPRRVLHRHRVGARADADDPGVGAARAVGGTHVQRGRDPVPFPGADHAPATAALQSPARPAAGLHQRGVDDVPHVPQREVPRPLDLLHRPVDLLHVRPARPRAPEAPRHRVPHPASRHCGRRRGPLLSAVAHRPSRRVSGNQSAAGTVPGPSGALPRPGRGRDSVRAAVLRPRRDAALEPATARVVRYPARGRAAVLRARGADEHRLRRGVNSRIAKGGLAPRWPPGVAPRESRIGAHVTFPRISPPFRIPARARPEVAIYWKNLTAGLRISSPWLLIMAVCALYFLGQSFYSSEAAVRTTIAGLALTLAALFPFLGSGLFTQDMRLDLPRIELLKSYPIAGERLVAAEIAAPLSFRRLVEIMMLTVAAIILHAATLPGKANFLATPQFVVIALIFAAPICAAQLLIRNAVPILLPGWAMRAPDEQRGFIVLGQRLLMTAGNLLVLLFMLLPAACIVVPGLLMAKFWFHDSMPVVALTTVLGAALLFFEVWLGIRFLGRQFEKIDVTNELDMVGS